MVKKKLERPVLRALGRLAVLLVIVAGVLFAHMLSRIAQTKRRYSFRLEDLDGDARPNCLDDDVDNDGLFNMEDSDANDNGLENWEDAVLAARKLEGMRIDHFRGAFNNLGVRMGWARNATVVLLAYEQAGVYLAPEIDRDAREDPSAYEDVMRGGEVDVHDARALRRFLERQGWLVRPWSGARIGDVIFFRGDQIAIVTDISSQDVYEVIWADPDRKVVTRCPLSGVEAQGYDATDYAAIGE